MNIDFECVKESKCLVLKDFNMANYLGNLFNI